MAGGRKFSPEDDAAIARAYLQKRGMPGWVQHAAQAIGRSSSSVVNRKLQLVGLGRWRVIEHELGIQPDAVADSDSAVQEWAARRDAAKAEVDRIGELVEQYRPVELPPIPFPETTRAAGKTTVVSSDHHWPVQDPRCESIILQAIEILRPRRYILNGDGPDMLSLSKYPKDARRGKSWELRTEQHHAKNWWWNVAKLMRQWDGELYETEANHSGNNRESRWRRWLNENCPVLFQLDGMEDLLTYQRFFHPADAGVQMVDEVVIANDLRVRHGEVVRKHGGYSARAHGDKWQASIMHGHTHRIGSSIKRRPGIPGVRPDEFLKTFETGCACLIDADYCPGADWQQGFAIIHEDTETDSYGVECVQIINGRATSVSLGGTISA